MKHSIYIITVIGILLAASCKKSKVGGNGGIVLSTNKSIISFVFKAADNVGLTADIAGVVSADSVVIPVPYGTSITALKPTIQHNGVAVTPVSGAVQNFNLPVTYVVKAEDGSSKNYIAVVKIIIKSTVYAGSADGKLYAFDGDDGTLKWTYSTGGAINSTCPTYFNGTVFIASSDGYVHAVDAVTGAFKWKYSSRGTLVSNGTPALNSGILYFASGTLSPLYFTAINASTGTFIWEKTNPSFFAGPTWYNGIVYAGGLYGLGGYYAIDGTAALSFNNNISPGNPVLVNNVLYAGTEGTVVTAYNTATAAVKWQYLDVPGGSPTAGSGGSPTLYKGTIYNTGYTRSMYAIDSATGALRWKFNAGPNTGFLSSPAVANGIVYTVNTTGHIYALDAATGNERWNYNDGTAAAASILNVSNCTVKNDIVYYGSYSKKLYALNALTGLVKWQYTTGGNISGGALIVAQDGSVYHPAISGEQQ